MSAGKPAISSVKYLGYSGRFSMMKSSKKLLMMMVKKMMFFSVPWTLG